MDYSLLVGIHDCMVPPSDDDSDSDDGGGDLEEYEDNPATPTSLTSGND